ncbi:BAG family molecular chaperone regulator 3-like, partial [Asparagus officinalis]|uniref:BAG family molecular chaperone regulator 3-like n=1 Tax=Asparagus officinalis TaxID=4686 RepID=UPI00098E5835
PTVRVKVKYDSVCYEIYLSSQSTFGELKKLLAERTGVHWEEQKILYKEREREGREFLDVCGVKDKSKMVMGAEEAVGGRRTGFTGRSEKDTVGRGEGRGGREFLGCVRSGRQSSKMVIGVVTHRSAAVSDVESTISKGKKVADEDLSSLIEQLMTQLVKLDAIVAEGDLKLQKRVQIRRIQKYVETLDLLKIKNAKTSTIKPQLQHNQRQNKQQASIVVTAEWEMFDSLFGPSTSASSSAGTSSSSSTSAPPRSDWELF